MNNYSYRYGVFHWLIHYLLIILLVEASEFILVEDYTYYDFFGISIGIGILNYIIPLLITSLIDLDHLQVLMKFGPKNYVHAQKRLVSPLHNFFFLSFFSIVSAFSAIFISRVLAILTFTFVVHLLWDMFEDVFIFRTSFRRWEKTWGLNKKDIEEAYKTLVQPNSSS